MPGVRLVHPNYRATPITVEDLSRRYRQPLLCAACKAIHKVKTYHLELDGEGAVIVSELIARRLMALGVGFQVANEVAKPPTRRLEIAHPAVTTSVNTPGSVAQMEKALRDLAPKGVKPRVVPMPIGGSR